MVPIKLQLAIQSNQKVRGIRGIEESVNLLVSEMAGKLTGKIANHHLVAESRSPITFEFAQGPGIEVLTPESANQNVSH